MKPQNGVVIRTSLIAGSLLVAMLSVIVLLTGTAAAAPTFPTAGNALNGNNCDPDLILPDGTAYRFCVPPAWVVGDGLLVYAHGYVYFNEPLAIPEDQICLGEPGNQTCINDIVNDLGIAFATTSYPTNGLAVLPALPDVVNLVDVFSTTYGEPGTVLIAGVSEGGLVTTLAVERYPEVFDGGLAACGPIGDWVGQINYFGDFRVLFDYFFPDIIPTEVVTIPNWLITAWSEGDYFTNVVAPVVFDPASTLSLSQLLATSQFPYVPGDDDTIRMAIEDGLAYNIMATNEVMEKMGGNPFDNVGRIYSGSDDDATLNAQVRRFAADPAAVQAMTAYETSGRIDRPLVTLHTSRDQQVPQWHELLYRQKLLANHSWMWHIDQPVPVDNYGHCNFDPDQEVLPAFFALLGLVVDPPQPSFSYLPALYRQE